MCKGRDIVEKCHKTIKAFQMKNIKKRKYSSNGISKDFPNPITMRLQIGGNIHKH